MKREDIDQLVDELRIAVASGARCIAILGLTPEALDLVSAIGSWQQDHLIEAIYDDQPVSQGGRIPIRSIAALAESQCDLLVVASDKQKEPLLQSAVPHLQTIPRVLIGGYGHFEFHDAVLEEEVAESILPSFANGYANTLTHLYQCLLNAKRLNLEGVVAEFGMFKGGTTMLLLRLIERVGAAWPVVGFDTFEGFPERRSALDMYDHPGCVFHNLADVQRVFAGHNVQIIPGDIAVTAQKVKGQQLVMSFIDTDNYTPARAAVEVCRDSTVVGGSIVFDHFTGANRFKYTLGERMAALDLLNDIRYFHLHGTGVFYRQR